MTLRDELRQRKPFDSRGQEVFLSVARTEAVLREGVEQVLAARDLSIAQYNVLRILRGAGPEGLCRNEVRDRLITRMPDVTRLLDRMAAAGLVRRVRGTADRRHVRTTLTEKARALLEALDAVVMEAHERQLAHLTASEQASLVQLLALARGLP